MGHGGCHFCCGRRSWGPVWTGARELGFFRHSPLSPEVEILQVSPSPRAHWRRLQKNEALGLSSLEEAFLDLGTRGRPDSSRRSLLLSLSRPLHLFPLSPGRDLDFSQLVLQVELNTRRPLRIRKQPWTLDSGSRPGHLSECKIGSRPSRVSQLPVRRPTSAEFHPRIPRIDRHIGLIPSGRLQYTPLDPPSTRAATKHALLSGPLVPR